MPPLRFWFAISGAVLINVGLMSHLEVQAPESWAISIGVGMLVGAGRWG